MSGPSLGDELYREIVLEHHRRPHHRGLPATPTTTAEGVNPLCGDEVRIGVVIENGTTIAAYGFDGSGCAISQASASLLGDAVSGRSAGEAREIIAAFESLVRGQEAGDDRLLGDLVALEGVSQFPMRVKCATLAARTLGQALDLAQTAANRP